MKLAAAISVSCIVLASVAACDDDSVAIDRVDGSNPILPDGALPIDAAPAEREDAEADGGGELLDARADAATDDAEAQTDADVPLDASDGGPTYGPHVVASMPAEGATIYPFEMVRPASGAGLYVFKRVIRLELDRAMDVSLATVHLSGAGGDERDLSGTWDDQGRVLSLDVPLARLPVGGGSSKFLPLTYVTAYRISLAALRDADGVAVDSTHPTLGDGVLDFTTMPKEAIVEHTCGHTFEALQPAYTLGLASDATSGPAVGVTHKRYSLTAPGVAPYRGYASWPAVAGASEDVPYSLFLQSDLPVTIVAGGAPVAIETRPVTPVCAALRFVKRFTVISDQARTIEFGPMLEPTFEAYFESEQ